MLPASDAREVERMSAKILESGQPWETPEDVFRLLLYFAFDPLDAVALSIHVFTKLKGSNEE